MLFGPPLRHGSSEYHLRQARWRHRFLRSAKNSRRAPGSQPGDYLNRLLASNNAEFQSAFGLQPSHRPEFAVATITTVPKS